MTKTPRTDAVAFLALVKVGNEESFRKIVSAKIARQLEQENETLKEQIEAMRVALIEQCQSCPFGGVNAHEQCELDCKVIYALKKEG